jgi:hypothetical protein
LLSHYHPVFKGVWAPVKHQFEPLQRFYRHAIPTYVASPVALALRQNCAFGDVPLGSQYTLPPA